MRIRHTLLASAAMTPAERAMGRFMRAPDHGADDGGAAPAPSPAPTEGAEGADDSAADFGAEDDFAAFEAAADGDDNPDDNPDDDGSGADTDPASPSPDDADEEDPPASDDQQGASVEERIGELTAKQRQAERDRDEARRERDELRQRLEAQDKGDKPEDSADQKGDPKDQRPDPEDYEFGEADSKFIADLARYETRQEINQQREQDAATAERQRMQDELRQVETSWTERTSADEVKTKYADFDEKVTKGADRGDWALSPIGTVLVKSSEVGPDVAYHLASNPDESRRIAGLSPVEQAIEIGRLEGRYMAEAAKSAEPAPAKTTQAPPPPQQRSRGTGGKYAAEPDTEDFAAFDRMADGILTS